MGSGAGWAALAAGVLAVLLALASLVGLGPDDAAAVAGAGLLVTAGAASVAFASAGTDRRRALAGAGLGLVPALVLAVRLAAGEG